jgi:predicted permease
MPAGNAPSSEVSILRDLARDASFAVRQFARARAFAAGIALSLAFGIGATATVYSWMQGMLLDPLPGVRDFDRLITARPIVTQGFGISLDEYHEWRDQARAVDGYAAASLSLFAVESGASSTSEDRRPHYGMFVSSNYFDVLGVPATHGRGFVPDDDAEGARPVAVLSDAVWRGQFGAARDIVGRTIRVNGRPVEVIGITPPHFGGHFAIAQFGIWVPIATRPHFIPSEANTWRRRDARWLDVLGRLRPGVSLGEAHAEIEAIAARQASSFAENRGRTAQATPLDIGTARLLRPLFAALWAVTILVLLLICANVANLLLTRAAARRRELGVRVSLGASRSRLVRQLLTESAILAVLGAVVGVLLAAGGDRLLAQMIPTTSLVMGVHSEVDLGFLAFVIAITAASTLVFGLAPALVATRLDVSETLRNGSGGSSVRGGALRHALVVTQFAFALAILVCTAVFLRRDRNVQAMDLGFRDGGQVLLLQTEMSLAGYETSVRWSAAIDLALERMADVPGVRRAALASFVPLGLTGYTRRPVVVPSVPHDPLAPDRVLVNAVGPGYFELMGIPLTLGRDFDALDTPERPTVVIVNRAFAEKYFDGQVPLGRQFTLAGRAVRVVGVATNGRYDYRDIDDANRPLVYTAWHQSPSAFVTIHLRTDGNPLAHAGALRQALATVDPKIPLLDPITLKQHADVPFALSRSSFRVLGVLGAVALILATMGLFSVVSYAVTLRNREIGIRLALGASAGTIVASVLRDALRLTAYGTVTGVVGALALSTLMRSLVPQLPIAEVIEYAAPALVLALCAMAAGLNPARRAASVDPVRTIRSE